MKAKQAATDNEQRGAGQQMKAADDQTGAIIDAAEAAPQEWLIIGSKPVAHWVENEVRYVLSREHIGKRKRATDDKSDVAEIEDNGRQGFKQVDYSAVRQSQHRLQSKILQEAYQLLCFGLIF